MSCFLLLSLFWCGTAFAQSNLPACKGSDASRWSNCVGTFTHANGERYVGEFKDGKYNGQGTLTTANGDIYAGEWKDDRRNGQGTYTFVSGYKYVSEFKDDKANGQGTLTFANGDKYVGELKDYMRNGQGTLTTANGDIYVGEWKDDRRSGQGTRYASNGSIINQGIWDFGIFVRSVPVQQTTASSAQPNSAERDRLAAEVERKKRQELEKELALNKERERLAQESNLVSNTSPTSAASMWLPVFNLPRCEGSDVTNWNGCIGITFQQGKPYSGQFRNGSPYGQLEVLNNSQTQMAEVSTLPQQQITELNTQEKQRLENEKLRAEATLAIQRQQELEEQLRQAQESRKKEQDSILADQKSNGQKRLFEEARIKEQQRLALEASEISRLRAEAEESKRKQAELEEQLRLAKLQNQISPPSALTTMANRKALVIGNDTYKSVTKLFNAREDAKAIASNLTAVGYKVTLQLDLNEKEMKAALRTFSSQVQGGDEVMFFFAGHGVQLGATNYLLPTDIGGESEAQVKDEAIQLQRVLDDMTEKKAKFTLAMIDACRDNPFKSMGRNIGGRGLAPTTAATGQMVVFSAGSGQQALDRLGSTDKNKNGVFTRTFLKEMQKSGVSIDRIVKNVRNEVAELAKTIGHDQVPAIYDQVLGDFYFKK